MQFFLHCTFQIHYQQKYQLIYIYDHNYYNTHSMFLSPIEQLHDHNYCIKQDKNTIPCYIIDQQYADGIGFTSNNKNIIDKAMKNIYPMLEERNFTINEERENIQHAIN